MIRDALGSAFASLWAKISYYLTFQFVDPFWFWLMCALIATAAICMLAWFLMFPRVRAVLLGFVLAIWGALWIFRFGEQSARKFDRRKR